MYIKEKLQPNKVNAPTLFIGVGGIGSKIVAGIERRCIGDDKSNLRFVIMDTDVNDLLVSNKGSNIVAVQTSSTSSVEKYLDNDKGAKNDWFPVNKMLDQKTVSEGAGQVRAISRLALNDIIKNGSIVNLYKAIDDLFLKDGGDLKQAVRVVISSTAAGGTGSGIAMAIGLLVRHYIKKNYPEAAVMIRGFLVMPGVLDTVISSQSEKDSLRCNGYATIKEINAFMMKGSGFFDTVPELFRYKNLCVSIPNASGGEENISGLPFDFCFLMDRTDSNAGNMMTLGQYIDYASQSLYEQNVGPMGKSASSKEDNVLKLCINPDKLGRCRFGGVGASIISYPYEDIRTYIALNWARSAIIGSSADSRLTAKEREELLKSSWLQYDEKYKEEYKEWEENPSSSSRNEPTRSGVYVSTVEAGQDPKNGNDFSMMLWDKYLNIKIDDLSDEETERTISVVAQRYIDALIDGAREGQLENEFGFRSGKIYDLAKNNAPAEGFTTRYNSIYNLEDSANSTRFKDIVKSFAKEVFNSKATSGKDDLGEYMLQKFLSVRGKIVHPNAARYLLYKLYDAIEKRTSEAVSVINSFEDVKFKATEIDGEGKGDDKFEVKRRIGHEKTLSEMCEAVDKIKVFENLGGDAENCNGALKRYYNVTINYFEMVIAREICDIARSAVSNLIKSYEDFYTTLDNKIPSIEKKKEDIVTKLRFKNGDCVRYVLGDKKYLDKLSSSIGRPSESGEDAADLYAKIFEALRNNAYIEKRRSSNPFNYENKADIFDDIIVNYYIKRADNDCTTIQVPSVLHALKLEYNVKCAIELAEVSEDIRDKRSREIMTEDGVIKHIKENISRARNLASPSIKKNDNEEPREVDAIACNEGLIDSDGIRVSDFIPNAIYTGTVSKYELHFFRSVYNIMPTQLTKFCAPTYDDRTDEFTVSDESEDARLLAGDYFRIYQKYMDTLGPDSKTSATITPHIDIRWNAISALPEIDIVHQRRLMRKIQKAMIYGFLYRRIVLKKTSCDTPDYKIYKYLNNEDDTIDLVVSNKTTCDILYEVLDSLYIDRLAVATIRKFVNELRIDNENRGFRSIDDLEFFKKLKELRFRHFVNDDELKASEDSVSLFSFVLAYCNSLPAQNKDLAEMKTMIDAIVEMLYSEVIICASNNESIDSKVAEIIVDQFNLLIENYNAHAALNRGIFSEQVIGTIRRHLTSFFRNPKNAIRERQTDLKDYIGKLAEFDED